MSHNVAFCRTARGAWRVWRPRPIGLARFHAAYLRFPCRRASFCLARPWPNSYANGGDSSRRAGRAPEIAGFQICCDAARHALDTGIRLFDFPTDRLVRRKAASMTEKQVSSSARLWPARGFTLVELLVVIGII